MLTLRQFAAKPETVPATTAWYLADLGEALGKQALFTKQSPQATGSGSDSILLTRSRVVARPIRKTIWF